MQQEFIKAIITRLEALGLPYAVTGSVASNLWGTPRLTHDIDILVVLTGADVRQVAAAFSDPYYVSESGVLQAALSGGMFNVIDAAGGYKGDFWVSSGDPFSQSLLSRRQKIEIVPGHTAYVASAEDVLLHKLVWHKITPSERQLGDAAGIAAVQAGKLDLDYLRRWAARQGTADLLENVLQGKNLKKT